MNSLRTFGLVVVALAAGFLAARWLPAQSAAPAPAVEPIQAREAGLGLRQLESFHAYLGSLKQEEALRRFEECTNSMMVIQNTADLGLAVAALNRIRGGNLDGAIQLLEMRMTSAIAGFDSSYMGLPAELREEVSLKVLEHAKAYRDKFPAKDLNPLTAEMEAKAFKLLTGRKER